VRLFGGNDYFVTQFLSLRDQKDRKKEEKYYVYELTKVREATVRKMRIETGLTSGTLKLMAISSE